MGVHWIVVSLTKTSIGTRVVGVWIVRIVWIIGIVWVVRVIGIIRVIGESLVVVIVVVVRIGVIVVVIVVVWIGIISCSWSAMLTEAGGIRIICGLSLIRHLARRVIECTCSIGQFVTVRTKLARALSWLHCKLIISSSLNSRINRNN